MLGARLGLLCLLAIIPSEAIFLGGGTFSKTMDTAKALLFGSKPEPQASSCRPALLLCRCGSTQKSVTVRVPQCTRFHRFRSKCGPCDGMTADKICPIFQNCAQCSSKGDGKCSKCPPNRFGDHCDNECGCRNGAACNIEGRCLCPQGFEGELCDRRAGCDPPASINSPLVAEYIPPEQPATIIYRCPSDYEMEGPSVSSCLPEKRWSSPPPACLRKCPVLSEPARGHLKYSGTRIVEGVTAEATCYKHHRLIGTALLTCQPDGTWDHHLPKCQELATCPDPGDVPHAIRAYSNDTTKLGGYFMQESKLLYSCEYGFEHFGAGEIMCLFDGNWSRELPFCVKASSVVPNCQTKGSQVVVELGVPVRMFCPPECAETKGSVWGTSIYRASSSVCAAAVHSGKLTNTGGLVAVINNGEYTNFAGSNINNMQTLNYESRDESFRFDKLEPVSSRSRGSEDCPPGLERLKSLCVYASSHAVPQNVAEAKCTNLGLQLDIPKSEDDRKFLQGILLSKGIRMVWLANRPSPTATPNGNATDVGCEAATSESFDFERDSLDCTHALHFVCIHKPTSSLLASCVDPGPLESGLAKPMGKVEEAFYVGASIEYSCESLHYLKGNSTIYCRSNGTWSDEKPTCVRVDTCEDPPIPIGGFVNFLPPLNTLTARTALIPPRMAGYRLARIPHGLDANPPPGMALPTETPTEEPDIDLPEGWHKVGTRAMYDCESRYYTLVGSKTRRCEGKGRWSGRPPTCIPVCGRSDSARSPFIVNGNASDIGQWPWQAGVARYIPDMDSWYLLCGGALLNERWVLTAAHCVTYSGTTITFDPDKYRVYLGKYHRKDSLDDEYVQTKAVKEIHIHPDYEPQIYDADIALIMLETPVQLNTRAQPVCLPTQESSGEHLKPGSKGVVTGWGMNENQTNAETLQQAVVPVVSKEECEDGYMGADLPLTVTENMFCAGYKEGRVDACSGDSGGPIVFLDQSSKERRWEIQGVVSWGSPNGCGHANQYGGYTKVSSFLDWIHLFF